MRYLFLHGLGQQPDSWDAVLAACALRGEVECPDLAAWLRAGDGTYAGLYRTFAAACAQGGTAPVCLCGLSLGAVLALQYAIAFPGRVHALVLIAPQYQMPKWLLRLQNFLFRLLPAHAFSEMGLSRQEMIRLTRSMETLDFSRQLDRITCPVLVLCGARDRTNHKAAVQLARHIRGAVYQAVPDAGHEVNCEAHAALARILCEFYGVTGEGNGCMIRPEDQKGGTP